MSYPIFYVPAGDVLPVLFATYAGSTGASVTLTGLAVTDIEIYKDGGVTQRASDAGYTLLDTDGIDFDGTTGIHGFSIDTGDNTDAGFYTVGAWFHVVVSAVTVDSQTVNFIAAAFRLMPAESVAGKPKVDTDTFGGTAGTFSGGRPEVNVTHWLGTAAQGASGRPQVDVELIEGADPSDTIRDAVVDDATRIDASALNSASGNVNTSLPNAAPSLEGGLGLVDASLAVPANVIAWDSGSLPDLPGIETNASTLVTRVGTPTDFGSGVSTLAANLQDLADNGTATYDRSTDSLQAIRDRGDAAWVTATGFATAANLSTVSTRVLLALPAVAPGGEGGLYVMDGTGLIPADAVQIGSAAPSTWFDDIWQAPSRTLTAFAFTPTPSNAADVTAILEDTGTTIPALLGDIPTAAENADALLGRNVAGGSSTGRTVSQALYALRNKVAFDTPSAGSFTVYATDDTTPAYTGTYTTDAGAEPVVSLDPA
jgi:hypothetical protein